MTTKDFHSLLLSVFIYLTGAVLFFRMLQRQRHKITNLF